MTSLRAAPETWTPSTRTTSPRDAADDAERIARSILSGRDLLLGLQCEDGHWCAELEGDTILESEFVLMQAILGRLDDPRISKCARYIAEKQQRDGGWSNYPDGPADVSVSVKAYFALKLAGRRPDEAPMQQARRRILDLGGAERVNSFTRFYLAALGQIPYSHCPSVPVEILLLPQWSRFNLYRMSSWTRTIVVPLSIVQAYRPVSAPPAGLGIVELFRQPPRENRLPEVARLSGRLASWENAFRLLDRAVKVYERYASGWLRPRALRMAEEWLLEHFEGSDGVGAIFPSMVYTVLALRCLGYSDDSPEMRWARKQIEDLVLEEEDSLRLQPCLSPVWDTTWTMAALAESGLSADHPALNQAADWLLDREVREPGDWSVRNPEIAPGGWAFEYANRFYPDVDDTATALMALRRTARFQETRCREAVERGLRFEIAMQSSDGGWGAFDRDVDDPILESIPFADHNAMLDPSCPDVTARVLEMLGEYGYGRNEPFVAKAIRFLLRRQEPEGCWFGRWGVNYIYGTWQALVGLRSIGYDMGHPRIRKAVEWLESVQQPSGGWGESCATYEDRSLMGQGPATPSQTAWAVLGLLAAGEATSSAVRGGVDYLARTQNADGSWTEPEFTGTGFPKVFYLKYHYYRLYFPLLALARYARAAGLPLNEFSSRTPSLAPRRAA